MKLKKIIKQVPIIEKLLIIFYFIYCISIKMIPKFKVISDGYRNCFNSYFSDIRLNFIVNAAFILIGIYATITSVFGSSRSAAISKLSKNDLTKRFIIYITCAITSALIVPIYIIFKITINGDLLLLLIIWMFSSLLRFLIIILLIYNYNVDQSRIVDAEENEKFNSILDVLTNISIEIRRNKD